MPAAASVLLLRVRFRLKLEEIKKKQKKNCVQCAWLTELSEETEVRRVASARIFSFPFL